MRRYRHNVIVDYFSVQSFHYYTGECTDLYRIVQIMKAVMFVNVVKTVLTF